MLPLSTNTTIVMIRLIVIVIVVIVWSIIIVVKSVVSTYSTPLLIVLVALLLVLITIGLTIAKILLARTHLMLGRAWLKQTKPLLPKGFLSRILQGVVYGVKHWLHTRFMLSQYLDQFLNDVEAEVVLNEAFHHLVVTQFVHEALYSFIFWFFQDSFYNVRRKLLNWELHQVRLQLREYGNAKVYGPVLKQINVLKSLHPVRLAQHSCHKDFRQASQHSQLK